MMTESNPWWAPRPHVEYAPHADTTSLIQAFLNPLRAPHRRRTILTAALMAMFSWLFLPTLLMYGYLAAIIKSTARNEPIPPSTGWFTRAGNGATIFAAILIASAPIILLSTMAIGALFLISFAGLTQDAPTLTTGALIIAGSPLLALSYALPAVVVRTARTNTLRAAVSLTTLRAALSKRYATAVLLSGLGAGILGPALVVSWVVPLIGPLLWSIPFVVWVTGCSAMFALATPGTPDEFIRDGNPGRPVPLNGQSARPDRPVQTQTR